MAHQRLSEFIRSNIEPLLQAWQEFARTIEPPALAMNDEDLRDHARQMLQAFAADLDRPQSDHERAAKSQGLGQRNGRDSAAETHAEARLRSGYTLVQLVSEYRALRSSVLSLWSKHPTVSHADELADTTRFNEAVDQALAESVARYEALIEQSRHLFLAILGHDLRNPLGNLVSGSSFIARASDISEPYAAVAMRMLNSAKRMSNLITDLIDFTRGHLGAGIPVQPRQGELVSVCEQVIEELRTFHPGRVIALQAPARVEALLDDARIAQMLSNLVGNAMQYGSHDSPVVVRIASTADALSISVSNQGPPIPAEKLATIFDPMVRGETADHPTSSGSTSLGLGLYVAREIVQAHGGVLNVTSSAADGTTFTAHLPQHQAA